MKLRKTVILTIARIVIFFSKKEEPKKAELQNFHLSADHFTKEELACAFRAKKVFPNIYASRGIEVNHISFDLQHYYRVKQARGLVKSI